MQPRSSARNGILPAEEADDANEDARPLPLQATVDALEGGWSVRLPVRAEYVSVTKEAIFLEEVRIWRASHQEAQTVTTPVRSERLVVDDADVTR